MRQMSAVDRRPHQVGFGISLGALLKMRLRPVTPRRIEGHAQALRQEAALSYIVPVLAKVSISTSEWKPNILVLVGQQDSSVVFPGAWFHTVVAESDSVDGLVDDRGYYSRLYCRLVEKIRPIKVLFILAHHHILFLQLLFHHLAVFHRSPENLFDSLLRFLILFLQLLNLFLHL